MNYKKIQLGNKELFFDADAKRISCKDCGMLIRFAQDEVGKYYPINSISLDLHHCVKRAKSILEENVSSEERNQEFLNNL